MKTSSTRQKIHGRRLASLGMVLALVAVSAGTTRAQETLLALGRVTVGGALSSGTTTIGGTLSVSRPATGDYFIEVQSPGTFAGAFSNDFLIHATMNSLASNDELPVCSVDSLTDDVLTVRVRIADVEDSTDPDQPEERNGSFHFAIHRVGFGDTLVSGLSRYLCANGIVASDGSSASGLATGGETVVTSRLGAGHYQIVIQDPGAFATDNGGEYVLLLSPTGYPLSDELVRGSVSSTASDDEVVFEVFVDDVQDESNDDTVVPVDKTFHYTLYRMTLSDQDRPGSRLQLALGLVQGGTGSLSRGALSVPGGSISSAQNGTGVYSVFVEIPGYFAGRTTADFVPQVLVRRPFLSDEAASATGVLVDANTYRVDIATADVEESGGNLAVNGNESFSFLIHEAYFRDRSDLRVGRTPKLGSMKGNNRYHPGGAGQRIRVRTARPEARFYFAVENDGTLTDNYNLRRKGSLRNLKARFLRLTGGRMNVTGKVMTSGYIQTDVAPQEAVRFLARTRMRNPDLRRAQARIQTNSLRTPSSRDAVRALVVSGKTIAP